MKFLIPVLLSSLVFSTHANALGKREEGVLIGLGSAILVGSVLRDRNQGGDYGYGRYGDRNEFPPFRCRANSVPVTCRSSATPKLPAAASHCARRSL